jgi:predicted kinase
MFASPTHSEAESLELYDVLNYRASHLLGEGKSVIFDTNFNYYADRQKLRNIADGRGAETIVIWLTTPVEVAKQRSVHTPELRNGYMVGMTEERFSDIVSKLEPPRENEKVIKIDGAKLDAKQVIELLKL